MRERDLEHHHHRGYHPEKYFAAFGDLADYLYINTAPEDEFSLRARTEKFARSIIRHIDTGSAEVHAQGSDLITRIAFRALDALPRIALPGGAGPLSPQSPQSPDFFMDSEPPCEAPDDEGFLDFLESMRFAPDTRAVAAGFVGELAATAALYARTAARVLDRVLTEGGELLAALSGAGPLDMTRLHAEIEAVNDTGVARG